jgi:hypothetical protein
LKNRHVGFVQYDAKQPIINLAGVGKTMFDHIDFGASPFNDINVRIDELAVVRVSTITIQAAGCVG